MLGAQGGGLHKERTKRSGEARETYMTKRDSGKEILENAYKLQTPDDNVAYYDEFAATYDSDFAQNMGYNYPRAIADIYAEISDSRDVPIADVGCGTGLVAEELRVSQNTIDGFDISPEMLRVAKTKTLYRALYEADLTGRLDAFPNDYGAVVSAGTFTHGHLGPGALENLLTMGRPRSLFVIGINKAHYKALNFGGMIAELREGSKIQQAELHEIPMYSKTDHEHGSDVAMVLTFRTSE
jgi:SAM-dependent methyltransferase